MINIPPGSHGIVYVRVSTAHQADDELPVDSQIAELTSAVASAGATCDVVRELGISGTDFEGRAGLQAIAARGREAHPNFSGVLVWKLSRFGRNMQEGLVYRALLRKRGIDYLSLKEPIPEGPLGIINTGTPPCVVLGMPGQPYLRSGDVVELGIISLGRQQQRFVPAP